MVRKQMKDDLSAKLKKAGVYVSSFDLVDLVYSHEISEAMLVRQSVD